MVKENSHPLVMSVTTSISYTCVTSFWKIDHQDVTYMTQICLFETIQIAVTHIAKCLLKL